ncbi:MAG: trypsin-like peptidase domain-containing protein [Acidobacteriota bacterium]
MRIAFNIRKHLSSARMIAALALIAAAASLMAVSAQQKPQLPSPQDLSRAFIEVARQVKPAVVSIDTVEKPKRPSARAPEDIPIPGIPFERGPRRMRGTGSGVIISSDGFILTNNHVAGDADDIKVKLSDGREFKARRVGTDPETDLAVIKIEADNLPHAKLGNSDHLEQGEWVIALGSPFGLQQTMTAGIVSATGRDLGAQIGQFTNFIQTDASINPGNSGGPLVNMQGEVVGINTLILSGTGVNTGVGFSIPSNLASNVYSQIVARGKVVRGYLGVLLKPITPSVAKNFGYTGTEGALVDDVASDKSPAAKAGLHSGDLILEFDGKAVKTPKQLTEMVADTPVGKSVKVKYFREGRYEFATIILAERPARAEEPEPQEEEEEPDATNVGFRSETVTPEIARQLKLKIASGAVIQNVMPDSPAAEAGLRRGDVIHRVNRTVITSRQDLIRAFSTLKGETEVLLQVERGGQLSFVTVSLEQ